MDSPPRAFGLLLATALLSTAPACGGPASQTAGADDGGASSDGGSGAPMVPELGGASRRFTIIATAADGLVAPRALAFDPFATERLWVADEVLHGVIILTDPGTPRQRAEPRVDRYGQHFMASVSSIAFGAPGRFASCQESRDEWNDGPQPADDFMGPTLWSSDLAIFAVVGQTWPYDPAKPEGSHLDMLHQSPLCMGIAHERDNVYWTSDGLRGDLVRYDFARDHGPGGGDHSDGIIRRYPEATIHRTAGVPGHMVVDTASGSLYVADTGAGRVMRLDTTGGTAGGRLPRELDGADYRGVTGAAWEVFAAGLGEPCGVALGAGRLLVSDHATGEVVAFELASGRELARAATGAGGLMGITLGPDGKLYLVDHDAATVSRLDP